MWQAPTPHNHGIEGIYWGTTSVVRAVGNGRQGFPRLLMLRDKAVSSYIYIPHSPHLSVIADLTLGRRLGNLHMYHVPLPAAPLPAPIGLGRP
jgi:hypothetical protein